MTTPAVRKIAKENNLDLGVVPATGPNGRILKSDVLEFIQNGGMVAAPAAAPAPAPVAVAAAAAPAAESPAAPVAALPLRGSSTESAGSTTVPISGMQRIMVKSMKASLQIPHFNFR